MTQSLDGVRVLDLSRFIAGPMCGMLLGDLGADVVKVERAEGGDDTRHLEPKLQGESLFIMVYNRNKRGITLNFRSPQGQALLRELTREADVILENFRPGTMEKMGCDWETLHTLNPRLIMTRVSGFGQDGPYVQRASFDVIAQAMSGLMEITGQPGGPPTMAGTYVADILSAQYATIGTLAALQARERTGLGQVVDVSLFESAISTLLTAIPEYLVLGREMTRHGNRDPYSAPANTFRTRNDEWVVIVAGNDGLFARFTKAIGQEQLPQDARFRNVGLRVANVAELEAIVNGWMSAHDTQDIVARMEQAGVPCAKVATIGELVRNPHVHHRQQIVEMEHPVAGKVPLQGLAVRLSHTPARIRRPSPRFGEHTAEVLAEWLHYDSQRIAGLVHAGTV